jgi:UDP-N-acetyl-D-mannosaminuronate dehydrogenase
MFQMTKSENREIINAVRFMNGRRPDIAARRVATLYRSARTTKSQNEILTFAIAYKLINLPDWIV